jgi:hypothetical protein
MTKSRLCSRRRVTAARGGSLGSVLLGALAAWPGPAEAHAKWFAPYIVGAPPLPVAAGHGRSGGQGVPRHAGRVRRVRDQPAPRAPVGGLHHGSRDGVAARCGRAGRARGCGRVARLRHGPGRRAVEGRAGPSGRARRGLGGRAEGRGGCGIGRPRRRVHGGCAPPPHHRPAHGGLPAGRPRRVGGRAGGGARGRAGGRNGRVLHGSAVWTR